jgi:hypothetical protein
MPSALDHLIYAVPDLDRAIGELEGRLGVRAVAGGRHLEEGTRNALIALGPDSYIEVLAPDPSQPAPDRPLWLGLEGLSQPRLTAWAIKASRLEDVRDRVRASGVRLGAIGSAPTGGCSPGSPRIPTSSSPTGSSRSSSTGEPRRIRRPRRREAFPSRPFERSTRIPPACGTSCEPST